MTILVLHDIWKVIQYEDEPPHKFDFAIYDVNGFYKDEVTGEYTVPFYETIGAKSSDDTTEDIEKAQHIVKGSIKWDGCSHIYFTDYMHWCGIGSWWHFQKAMDEIWNLATQGRSYMQDEMKKEAQ